MWRTMRASDWDMAADLVAPFQGLVDWRREPRALPWACLLEEALGLGAGFEKETVTQCAAIFGAAGAPEALPWACLLEALGLTSGFKNGIPAPLKASLEAARAPKAVL